MSVTNDVAQYDIKYRQEALSCREDDMKKAWMDYEQLKREAKIVHEKAKKEAIDKMSKILAETTEKETLKKIEYICDSLIHQAMALCNAILGKSEEEYRDTISK